MMKKAVLAISLVLALLCGAAFAAEVTPMPGVDLSASPLECTLDVDFSMDDVTETGITVTVYDQDIYDIVDIHELKIGDTITGGYAGTITVESINQDETTGVIDINGGIDEDGITLFTEEDTNGLLSISWSGYAYSACGQLQLPFADSVDVSVYKMEDDLSIAGDEYEYETVTVTAAEVKSALQPIADKLTINGYFSVNSASVEIEGGKVTHIIIDYVP